MSAAPGRINYDWNTGAYLTDIYRVIRRKRRASAAVSGEYHQTQSSAELCLSGAQNDRAKAGYSQEHGLAKWHPRIQTNHCILRRTFTCLNSWGSFRGETRHNTLSCKLKTTTRHAAGINQKNNVKQQTNQITVTYVIEQKRHLSV